MLAANRLQGVLNVFQDIYVVKLNQCFRFMSIFYTFFEMGNGKSITSSVVNVQTLQINLHTQTQQ